MARLVVTYEVLLSTAPGPALFILIKKGMVMIEAVDTITSGQWYLKPKALPSAALCIALSVYSIQVIAYL